MGRATSKGNEVKDEIPFRYAHAEIQTRVVVICDPTRYQLDHAGPVGNGMRGVLHGEVLLTGVYLSGVISGYRHNIVYNTNIN